MQGAFDSWYEEWHSKLRELTRKADAIRTKGVIQDAKKAMEHASNGGNGQAQSLPVRSET